MARRVRRRWWVLGGVVWLGYFVVATFGVYGGFYLGSPPLTPAFLNATSAPIVRTLVLDRRSTLRLWGELSSGRVVVRVDGEVRAQFTGRFERSIVLEAGRHDLRIENRDTSGRINYRLE